MELALLRALLPLAEERAALNVALHTFTRSYWAQAENKACSVIFNHALNDFTLLLAHLWGGDGRSAIRAARSLYEHLVNYCFVSNDPAAADRYLGHQAVTHQILAKSRKWLGMLDGTEKKKEEHHLNKLGRDSAKLYQDMLAAHSSKFVGDWARLDLYSRARLFDLHGDYDTYRLFSQVTHGSTGGVLGTVRPTGGEVVHRMGPSLELAIMAFPEGVSYFMTLASRIEALNGVNAVELVGALDALLSKWPDYRRACKWVDSQLWPENPPASAMAIMGIFPGGRVRWYLHESALKLIIAAIPPDNSEFLESKAKEQLEASMARGLKWDEEGRPFTVAVPVPVAVRPGAPWLPDNGILMPRARGTGGTGSTVFGTA
ncbi:DUF5677 domain-containing protein [Streptomyces sp. NPDC006430]|uniref:DUF5677 domain-containing protein n=1 Tax=Streptomyces sp. NPDC006430 TaxID=3154299 RepID=UPI0033A6BF3A